MGIVYELRVKTPNDVLRELRTEVERRVVERREHTKAARLKKERMRSMGHEEGLCEVVWLLDKIKLVHTDV